MYLHYISLIFTLLSFAQISVADDLQQLYKKLEVNCLQCHVNPSTKAPLIGDKAAWHPIVSRSKRDLLNNIYQGKAGMPPLGYCSSCTSDDFLNLTNIMAGLPVVSDDSATEKD